VVETKLVWLSYTRFSMLLAVTSTG